MKFYLNMDDPPKLVRSRLKAIRREFKKGNYVIVVLKHPGRKTEANRQKAEETLATICARVGARPEGKWLWRGKNLETILVKGF